MPIISIKGVDTKTVKRVVPSLKNELQKIIGCDASRIKFDIVPAIFYDENGLTEGNAIIELLWFGRSQEITDAVARAITDSFMCENYPLVQVIFKTVPPNHLFDNGIHH